ncbi:MAG: rubrerythrin [Chloroflexi bacterium]|nr:MAG: rubrerythrin [Chloroflexota bacterium]
MTKSYDDLMAAFAGESQANRKYLAFAKKADEEGFSQVARLFRAAAAAETVHALTHFRTAGEVKSTQENLKSAIAGEHYENTTMYPAFIKDAEAEGEAKALKSFTWANEAEKVHEMLYKEALETLGKPGEEYDYYICPVCGYTHQRSAPEKCPVCGVLGSKFEKIS